MDRALPRGPGYDGLPDDLAPNCLAPLRDWLRVAVLLVTGILAIALWEKMQEFLSQGRTSCALIGRRAKSKRLDDH